jgi:hypothetical protein
MMEVQSDYICSLTLTNNPRKKKDLNRENRFVIYINVAAHALHDKQANRACK